MQPRRELAWMTILVWLSAARPGEQLRLGTSLAGIERIKVAPQLTRITRRRPLRRTTALLYCPCMTISQE
jgi:hypothetical protein